MASSDRLRRTASGVAADVPLDVAVAVAYAACCFVLVALLPGGLALLVVLLPLLLFVPGYLVVAALYPWPRADESAPDESTASGRRSPGATTLPAAYRLVYSVVVSVVVVPFAAYALLQVDGLFRGPLNAALLCLVLAAGALAAWRNWGREGPFDAAFRRLRARERLPLASASRFERAATLFAGACVLFAVLSVPASLAIPVAEEGYTEYAVGTTDADGEFVAGGYPTEVTDAEEVVQVAVENNEGSAETYTVVTRLQAFRSTGDATTVTDECTTDRAVVDVADGERELLPRELAPCDDAVADDGDGLRVSFLFYRGEVPASAPTADADEQLHVRVNRTAG